MIRSGYDLMYVPSAHVWHAVSPLSNSSEKIYYMERSRIRFTLKNFDLLNVISFFFIFFGETLYVLFRDIKNRNLSRTKIRFKAIMWNLLNLKNTLYARKKHLSILQKNGSFQSYNKNLPLRSIKTKN
jgi:GT2 family glycosyltransferase